MEKNDEIVNTEKTKNGNLKKQKDCLIHLLTGKEYRCQVSKQATGSELIEKIYSLLDLVERDYFGLYFKDLTEEKYWLEPNKSIKKQVKNGPWSFYFSVKFYPPDPAQLLEDITRYYMVLQIRDDILSGRLACSFVTHALLGSFVVQSELGDYERGQMRGNYVREFAFAPNQTRELEEKIMELHKTHRGQTPEQAEKNYLENAKKLSTYGVDFHFAKDSDGIALYLGISWNGLLVYRDGALINRFAWPRIIKLSYLRSKFFITIRPLDNDERLNMIGFKLSNHRAAKNVWKAGVEYHGFFRLYRAESQRRSGLIRVGSKFRYSGRTQLETRSAVAKDETRIAPKVERTDSRKLRSGWDGSPVKHQLVPVKEEASDEIPPLPEKTLRKAKNDAVGDGHAEEETVVTTTREVVEEVTVQVTSQTQETVELPAVHDDEAVSLSSYSDDDQPDLSKLAMTEHQKQVHKMKMQFLESDTPRKADSQDSLDLIDARLSPRKHPKVVQREITSKEEITETIVTTETVVSYQDNNTEPPPEMVAMETDLAQKCSADDNASSASSISAGNNPQDGAGELDSRSSMDADDEDDPVPIVTFPQDRTPPGPPDQSQSDDSQPLNGDHSSSGEEDEDSVYVVTHPEDEDSANPHPNGVSPGDSIQIATVETRTVRVEEVLIPQDENEIRQVSLESDKDVNPAPSVAKEQEEDRSSLSSMSSASSNKSNEPNFYQPPTVKTAPLVVDSYVEEVPKGTTSPPMVQTELKTITYESTKPAAFEASHPQLVSSQIITSESEHAVTTTEITKVVRDGVSETRVEKQMVSVGSSAVDHNKAMAEMILDTQRNNPNISITKVVVHEERSVLGTK